MSALTGAERRVIDLRRGSPPRVLCEATCAAASFCCPQDAPALPCDNTGMIPTLGNPVDFVFVHHTAVSRATNPDQWAATDRYHKALWNFKSSLGFCVGYTYEISAAGRVRQARAEGEETAAVIGFNKSSISICLDGNFDLEPPTLEQSVSLRRLLIGVQDRHAVPLHSILPHRARCGVPPYKSCYGRRLSDSWARDLVTDPVPPADFPAFGSEFGGVADREVA